MKPQVHIYFATPRIRSLASQDKKIPVYVNNSIKCFDYGFLGFMKYIFIIYLFDVIDANILLYKFDQT